MKALMQALARPFIAPVCGLAVLCVSAAAPWPVSAHSAQSSITGVELAQVRQLEPGEPGGGSPDDERAAPRNGPERDAPSEDGTADGPEISPNETEPDPPSGCTFQKRPLELLV